MSKNKHDKVKISFVGMNASEVTGSMTLVEYPTKEGEYRSILLDCGLYQSNSLKNDYKINSRKLDFNESELDFIFLSHLNIDHLGLLPRLYKNNCNAQIYTYKDNVEFMPVMLKDSAYIMEKDCLVLSKSNPNIQPLYTNEDVDRTMRYVRGCDKNKIYQLDEYLSVEFIGAGHIIGSCQIILYIKKPTGNIVKIGFTGDIGNIIYDNPFVDKFEPITKCSVLIGECTYNDPLRSSKKKDREKDIEKLKSVIDTTCYDRNGIVLIPCFALQRVQTILKLLYDIYSEDTTFDIPIVIDSPLAVKLTNLFKTTLEGEQQELIRKITSWENVRMISDPEESKACVSDKSRKIVLSSSGMLTAGRSTHYIKEILPRANCTVVISGFMVEGSLGWKIKNESNTKKTITIDKKAYRNKCQIVVLRSLSSHMQYEQLINYYKNISNNGCEVICLVHGDKNKINFKKDLEEEISNINKTTKVVAVNKATSINV